MNRQDYRLTDAELQDLLEASRPNPYMVFGGFQPTTPRERAIAIWHKVADRVGCIVDSIETAGTGDEQDFTAIPRTEER